MIRAFVERNESCQAKIADGSLCKQAVWLDSSPDIHIPLSFTVGFGGNGTEGFIFDARILVYSDLGNDYYLFYKEKELITDE
jgi:hypothetical protein